MTAFTSPLRNHRHATGTTNGARTAPATRSSTAILLVATVAVLNVVGMVIVL